MKFRKLTYQHMATRRKVRSGTKHASTKINMCKQHILLPRAPSKNRPVIRNCRRKDRYFRVSCAIFLKNRAACSISHSDLDLTVLSAAIPDQGRRMGGALGHCARNPTHEPMCETINVQIAECTFTASGGCDSINKVELLAGCTEGAWVWIRDKREMT